MLKFLFLMCLEKEYWANFESILEFSFNGVPLPVVCITVVLKSPELLPLYSYLCGCPRQFNPASRLFHLQEPPNTSKAISPSSNA